MLMIEGGASEGRTGICIDRGSGRVRGVGGEDLGNSMLGSCLDANGSVSATLIHTCEDWALEELDQFINLNEHIHSHFQVGEYLEKIVCLLIGLSEQAKRKCGYSIVAPGAEKGD